MLRKFPIRLLSCRVFAAGKGAAQVFWKNRAFEAVFPEILKRKRAGDRMKNRSPALCGDLRRYSVCERRSCFDFQFSFISTVWYYWLSVSLYVLYQFLACEVWFPNELFHQVCAHSFVYSLAVLVSRLLRYLNFSEYPLAEIVNG